jgi:anti-sigma B factor antagonist
MSWLWAWADAAGQAAFRVEERDSCAVVVAAGEIDLATAAALGEALQFAAERTGRVVIDLESVTFMDATGVDVLVRARGDSGDHSVCVVSPPSIVRKVLRITALDDVIPVYDTRDGAAAHAV